MDQARLLFERPLNTLQGLWQELLFEYQGANIIVMAYGNWHDVAKPLVRVNSNCYSAQYLGSVECDCREQLSIAYERIVAEDAGLIIFLDQDGRGNGHRASMQAAVRAKETGSTQGDAYRSLGYSADARTYDQALAVIHALDVQTITLMTNNPAKLQVFIDGGIDAVPMRVVATDDDVRSLETYYHLKAQEGHAT